MYKEPKSLNDAFKTMAKMLSVISVNADTPIIETGQLAHSMGNIKDAAKDLQLVVARIKLAVRRALRESGNLAIQALRTELEKPEPEPVAFMRNDGLHVVLAVDRHNYHEAEKRFAIPLFTKEQL